MYRLHYSSFVITFLTLTFQQVESARILAVIPTPSYSHHVFLRPLWRELAHRGHEVVLMTTDPTGENITGLQEIDMSSAYAICRPIYKHIIDLKPDALTLFDMLTDAYFQVAEHEFALPQVRQIIDDPLQHFDVVLVQSHNVAFFGLPHRFKAPFISITSLDVTNIDHGVLGNAAHSVLYPYILHKFRTNLSFKERLTSFLFDILLHTIVWKSAKRTNDINLRLFGKHFPDYMDLLESVDLVFVNNNPLFSTVRPFSPSTISLAGGLHFNDPKALPRDLQQFLDASSKGVVYFSLGSNVNSKNLPKAALHAITETFNQLPYNILWKFEDDQLPGKPKNVKILKWIPQQDVLRHKNIKLFITQGGMHSLEEALFAHLPLIVIPFFADQEGNADIVVSKGVALHLDVKSLTVQTFKKAIFEVINNPMYKKNMKTLAMQIGDQPQTPLERAVWWTEYIIRHKSGQHLKGPRIPLYQYFYLDIWAFLIISSLAALAIVYFLYSRLSPLCKNVFPKASMKVKKL